MNEASWYKLKSGVWGVKIRHDGREGDAVNVTNKKGESKTVHLVARAAKFDDAQLWEVSSDAPEMPTHKTLDEEPF
jgi:hypothetical protein